MCGWSSSPVTTASEMNFSRWVEAHGFCVGPAATLGGDARLLVTRFDFAGRIDLRDEARKE